jgi:hypothetical protein
MSKQRWAVATMLVGVIAMACNSGDATGQARSVLWSGPFGTRTSEPHVLYTLLAEGFFRAPTGPDFDAVVAAWMRGHPNAQFTIIDEVDNAPPDRADAKLRVVWVTEGSANLNIELVRAGACPGSTMILAPGRTPRVPARQYEAFLSEVRSADSLAHTEKRGVWSSTS